MWNIRTNAQWSVQTLVGHSGTVRCLHLEGKRLVSGSTDKSIKVSQRGGPTHPLPPPNLHLHLSLSFSLTLPYSNSEPPLRHHLQCLSQHLFLASLKMHTASSWFLTAKLSAFFLIHNSTLKSLSLKLIRRSVPHPTLPFLNIFLSSDILSFINESYSYNTACYFKIYILDW